MAKVKIESDHDLLIRIDTTLDNLNIGFNNHLKHHWYITGIALSAALTGAFSLAVGIILFLIKSGVIK